MFPNQTPLVNQFREELLSEIQSRELIEADFIKINAQLSNMMAKYSELAKLEEQNENFMLKTSAQTL